MAHSSPIRVRFAIVGIFSALALAFLISPSNAQPGRPGGGIGGMPGRPITPLIPPIQPLRPPGGIGGMPGGIGGMPGGPGTTVYTWSCEKCKASLGTTTTPTSPHVRCPSCGVIFTGTTITPGGGGGFAPPITQPNPQPGFGMPPGLSPNTGGSGTSNPYVPPTGSGTTTPYTPPTSSEPTLPTNPAVGGSGSPPTSTPAPSGSPPTQTTPPSTSPPTDSSSSTTTPPRGSRSKTFALVGIGLGVILLLGALAALAFVVSNAAATKPAKRKPKRKVRDDE